MYERIVKPFFDYTISFILLFLFSPLLLLITIILFISFKSNPFFIQKRPGKNERIFKIIKFKTMNDNVDENGKLLPDYMRFTKIGAVIRKMSLDELPQLINVLKGEMSFIGPRPLLPEYLSLYNSFQKQRHNIKPGITGLAQVNGRNALSWEKKFEFDVYYLNNISFIMDFKILIKTFIKIIQRKGINKDSLYTMEAFKGGSL